ncbi:MAG: hypothetical protein AABP62_15230 [Planctomycetota bacterium]
MTTRTVKKTNVTQRADRNPDPITDEPGAHPVGVGIGAAVGGAATGAAAGALGGPIGAAVGAVVGAVAGGYGGKAVAESIDPTAEEAFWRETYPSRPYYDSQTTYDEYAPAYRQGWESRERFKGRSFDEIEPELGRTWKNARSGSNLTWMQAKHAARDAYDRVGQRNVDDVAGSE